MSKNRVISQGRKLTGLESKATWSSTLAVGSLAETASAAAPQTRNSELRIIRRLDIVGE